MVIAGTCYTDVLEPAASPGLIGIHAELLAAQVFRDLLGKKCTKVRGTLCATSGCTGLRGSGRMVGWVRASASPTHQRGPVDPSHLVQGATRRLAEKRVALPVLT